MIFFFSHRSFGEFIVPIELGVEGKLGLNAMILYSYLVVLSETKGNYLLPCRVCVLGKEKAALKFTQLQAIKIEQNAIKINSDIRT